MTHFLLLFIVPLIETFIFLNGIYLFLQSAENLANKKKLKRGFKEFIHAALTEDVQWLFAYNTPKEWDEFYSDPDNQFKFEKGWMNKWGNIHMNEARKRHPELWNPKSRIMESQIPNCGGKIS